ncbi:hypothetical protein [Aureimonas sp. ME7]|uniref:hypothetical protein n=1 Tax=Aureimonas sp. ME7 TaxID=2744252 RepID=UPI0015F69B21|nr:hypothetical protein [Aureimonas sp. ME7]
MIYLIEAEPLDPATGVVRSLRYGSAGYITEPGDVPAHAWFEPRVSDAGNFERYLFSRGRTRGESALDGGNIKLVNPDGELDFLLDLALDGRAIRILALEDAEAPWSSRQTVFVGLMEQATFAGREVEIRIRDRLDLLRETIQTERFKGTTTSGDATEAEGNVDLKDVLVPELFGSPRAISPIVVDAFNRIYRVARFLDGITAVRDTGVALTFMQDYPDVASLKAATLPVGGYATCLALGLVRTQMVPGSLTVDAYVGATIADRSAARLVRQMIPAAMMVDEDDFDTLHAANPAECYAWTGTSETTILAVVMALLNSIGASINVDLLGVVRVRRLELPIGDGVVFDETNILDRGEGFSRNAPGDQGDGVPARSVTLRWGRAYTVYSEQDLKAADDNVPEAVRSFVTQEWRKEVVTSDENTLRHPKGPEIIFDTCFVSQADAKAEAERLMAIYGARRDFFTLEVASDEAAGIEIGDVATLALDRFGLAEGEPVRVMGMDVTLKINTTTIEVWR